MVAVAGCLSMPLLRHHLARFWAKLFAINSSRIPPQPKPPSGAKSGLKPRAILLNHFMVKNDASDHFVTAAELLLRDGIELL